jgi:hypothetical protein
MNLLSEVNETITNLSSIEDYVTNKPELNDMLNKIKTDIGNGTITSEDINRRDKRLTSIYMNSLNEKNFDTIHKLWNVLKSGNNDRYTRDEDNRSDYDYSELSDFFSKVKQTRRSKNTIYGRRKSRRTRGRGTRKGKSRKGKRRR